MKAAKAIGLVLAAVLLAAALVALAAFASIGIETTTFRASTTAGIVLTFFVVFGFYNSGASHERKAQRAALAEAEGTIDELIKVRQQLEQVILRDGHRIEVLEALLGISDTERDFWHQHAELQQQAATARTAALAGLAEALDGKA